MVNVMISKFIINKPTGPYTPLKNEKEYTRAVNSSTILNEMKTNFDFIILRRMNIKVLKTIEKHGIKININERSINNGNSVSGLTPL